MTYGHLQADCLYTGISSGPNARCWVWEAFTFFYSTYIIWLLWMVFPFNYPHTGPTATLATLALTFLVRLFWISACSWHRWTLSSWSHECHEQYKEIHTAQRQATKKNKEILYIITSLLVLPRGVCRRPISGGIESVLPSGESLLSPLSHAPYSSLWATWRQPQNQKYMTYCTVVKARVSMQNAKHHGS